MVYNENVPPLFTFSCRVFYTATAVMKISTDRCRKIMPGKGAVLIN